MCEVILIFRVELINSITLFKTLSTKPTLQLFKNGPRVWEKTSSTTKWTESSVQFCKYQRCKVVYYVTCMSYRSLLPNGKAQNNFQTVAGHNDQPKKFLLGLALFLTGQKIGKKVLINPCVIFCWWRCCIVTNWENLRSTDVGCLF